MAKDVALLHQMTKDELRLAQMLKALGNPLRFRIMQYLAMNPVCITGDIVQFTDLAQSTVSQHLKVLRESGLVKGEVEGPATCYCIDPAGIQFLKTQVDSWLPDCCQEDGAEGSARRLPGMRLIDREDQSPSNSCCA